MTVEHLNLDFLKEGALLIIGEELTNPESVFTGHKNESIADSVGHYSERVLDLLSKGNWLSIISLARDRRFEDFLTARYSGSTTWNVAVHAAPKFEPSVKHTLPVYKMLGLSASSIDTKLVENRATYMARRREFPKILCAVPERVRSAPILMVGVRCQEAILMDIVNELVGLWPSTARGQFIYYLEEESSSEFTLLKELASECRVEALPCTLSFLANNLPKVNPRILKRQQEHSLDSFKNNLVSTVPLEDKLPPVNAAHFDYYRDSLLNPEAIDWNPYKCNLDWIRSESKTISDDVINSLGKDFYVPEVICLTGAAGVGKTTIMKRAAYNLAQSGVLVFWINNYNIYDEHDFETFIQALTRLTKKDEKIVIFSDGVVDGSLSASKLINQIAQIDKVKWSLVISSRLVDHAVGMEKIDTVLNQTITVHDVLSEGEYENFKDYLKDQGIDYDFERLNVSVPKRETKDFMCLLWYILPGSKRSIRASIWNEYKKIDRPISKIEGFSGEIYKVEKNLQKIYQIIAVGTDYNLPITGSFVIDYAGISWAEWEAIINNPDHAIWSLIYDQEFFHPETGDPEPSYRTRNIVVTEVVVRFLNEGSMGHHGEVTVLKSLISSCSRPGAVYSQVVRDLLCKKKDKLKNLLDSEYCELWDTARMSVTFDKVLQHHYGIYIKDYKRDLEGAYDEIRKALDAAPNPYLKQDEDDSYIHNSLAATLIRSAKEGRIKPIDAYNRVEVHITNARRFDALSMYSAHIQCRGLLQLAEYCSRESKLEGLLCVNKAFEILEEAKVWGGAGKSDKKLIEVEAELFEQYVSYDDNDVRDLAEGAYRNHGSQAGFVYLGRVLLEKAVRSKKGAQFKKVEDYLIPLIAKIENDGKNVDVQLYRIYAMLLTYWKYSLRRNPQQSDWERITELWHKVAISNSNDILPLFGLAISSIHQNKYDEARHFFNTLNSMDSIPFSAKRTVRGLKVDSNGNDQTYTGTALKRNDQFYIESSEVGTVRMARGEFQASEGAGIVFKLGITLTGLIAVSTSYIPSIDGGFYSIIRK